MYLFILAFVSAVGMSVLSPLINLEIAFLATVLLFAVGFIIYCSIHCSTHCSIHCPIHCTAYRGLFLGFGIAISGMLGWVFAQFLMENSVKSWLPDELQGREMWVEGYVISLPREGERNIRFDFEIVRSEFQYKARRISLSLFRQDNVVPSLRGSIPHPLPGEKWRFVVKLDRPHGTFNPGLFDFEAMQLSRRFSAAGYIRESSENVCLFKAGWYQYHHQLRYRIRNGVNSMLPDDRVRGLIIALLIGESGQIDGATWAILSNTGTNHLLIISGLHVGLVTALIYFCLKVLFRHLPFPSGPPALYALVLTFFYCLMAGMGLPVQRALIMITLGMFVLQLKRNVPVFLILLYALLVVVVVNPYSSLSAGYWLSFGAVASLILGFSGRTGLSVRGSLWQNIRFKIQQSVRTQWVVFVSMAPLLIYWLHQFSVVGFVVNLIAIPFIAILIIPILLFALSLLLINPWSAQFPLSLAHYLLTQFMGFLNYFSELNWVFHQGQVSLLTLMIALVGSLILLLPRGLLPRWLGLILFLPLAFPLTSKLEKGDLSIRVLDVGQGLSVVIETQNHVVVYDAGPKWGNGVDAGTRIVYPVLKTLGHRLIHTLIISHSDLDHAGGLEGLKESVNVLQYFTGEPEINGGLHCNKDRRWRLDEIEFRFLNDRAVIDQKGVSRKRNDRSCVLLVTAGDYRILLPGDIETGVEEYLSDDDLPRVDLLIAPHHGSLSSSSPGFLNRLQPEIVVVSAGFHNKFNHPNSRVTQRYRLRGMKVFNTAERGAISITYQGGMVNIDQARLSHPRFWR